MPLNVLPDSELVAQVPAPEAVRALYKRHVEAVLRFAIRRCRSPDDVADLVSSVFVELFSAAPSYDPRYKDARPWLLGIAARCLADGARAQQRRNDLTQRLSARPSFEQDEYERVEEMLDAARLAPRVERALEERLTSLERDLFLLVAADGLTPAQAARSLGVSAVAARMRLSRARRKLRMCVSDERTLRPSAVTDLDLDREPRGAR